MTASFLYHFSSVIVFRFIFCCLSSLHIVGLRGKFLRGFPLIVPGRFRAATGRVIQASSRLVFGPNPLPSPPIASPRLTSSLLSPSSPPIASPRLVLSRVGSHVGVVLAPFFDLFDDVYKNTRTCDFLTPLRRHMLICPDPPAPNLKKNRLQDRHGTASV